ncbi:tail fiber domain-containing protein [Chryseobacterium polytrichastri]|uniref:Chaperone of endosialidase n=1 Tax=Chryseobacterium polytrichastri TaxID=1302687 RepID=A0A1M6V430_9FLAO|nr:tail fiber domain-containing protein [Chryseobacterium polytrichastri]SHK76210.1 Chaperone of endosialidase [Chryseobacterium polytrichastri]
MKKFSLSIIIALSAFCSKTNAQVGVNTVVPAASLDVTAKNTTGTTSNVDGLLVPRVDRQRAQSMTGTPTSTLVYVNSVATGTQAGTAVNIDTIGYYYYNGAAWIKLPVNLYNSDGALSGNRIVAQNANTLAFTGTSTNMYSINAPTFSVDAANNRVGIGTTAPVNTLHTVSAANSSSGFSFNLMDAPIPNTADDALLRLRNTAVMTTGNKAALGFSNNGPTSGGPSWEIGSIRTRPAASGGDDFFVSVSTGGAQIPRVRINANSGFVGIGTGTADPTEMLQVVGNILASGTITPSDIRIKKDITDNSYGLKELLGLRTISYKYKDEKLSHDRKIGFVAQEVKEAIPELVVTANDNMKTLGVNYAEMTVVLTKAIQEQQKMIDNLTKKVEAQQVLIDALNLKTK